MLSSEHAKLLELENILQRRVIGEGAAIPVVADSIRRTSRGSPTPTARSAPSSLSVQPALARPSWSHRTESRLIGTPPGYDRNGQLTETVSRRPFSE